MVKRNNIGFVKIIVFGILLLFNLSLIMAAAEFAVNTFSCSPAEVVINDVFSCTAQVKNNGDAAGSVSVATLYTDANDWLEDSNYAQASGTSVDPGQTTEITFTSLRAVKSGNSGFSKVMLDDVTDTYVADNNIKENVIDVVVTVSNSASSVVMSATFDSTAEVTVGGNVDISLTFTVNSGGCSIGNQDNPKTISGMTDGNKQSRAWTVTQGTSGDCDFKISAAATGSGGVASKTSSISSTITCSDCPTDDGNGDDTTTSGGGGGGGGGSGTTVETAGELKSAVTIELKNGENFRFNISDEVHFLSVTNLTATTATIIVESEPQTFTLTVKDEIKVDFDGDGMSEISVKLKSINLITLKAKFIINPISVPMPVAGEEGASEEDEGEPKSSEEKAKKRRFLLWIVIIFVILAIIAAYFAFIKKRKNKWLEK